MTETPQANMSSQVQPKLQSTDNASEAAQLTAQGFLDQLKQFSASLGEGKRLAVLTPTTGERRLFVSHVTVRAPEVICMSGVDADGMPFATASHYSQFNVHMLSYRVS